MACTCIHTSPIVFSPPSVLVELLVLLELLVPLVVLHVGGSKLMATPVTQL